MQLDSGLFVSLQFSNFCIGDVVNLNSDLPASIEVSHSMGNCLAVEHLHSVSFTQVLKLVLKRT